MSWGLRWLFVAEADLKAIPWRLAASVDAAVMRFAATGRGELTRVSPTDPHQMKLRVPGAEIRLFLDWHQQIIEVQRVFRRD